MPLLAWKYYHSFRLAFWEAYFHNIRGKETLSRLQNTTDGNLVLTETFSASTELCNSLCRN
jgi:hypothetical protein